MLKPLVINQIQALVSDGVPFKEISRRTGVSRNTVKKYARMIDGPAPTRLKKRNLLDTFVTEIEERFLACEGNCVVVGQQLKERLGLEVHPRRLRRFCAQWREKLAEPTKQLNRYETKPGQHLQIDFGERDVTIDGAIFRIHFFVSILGYSRRIFVKAYPTENQSAWFDGIETAFAYYKGVPLSIVSDNARALVTEHRGGLMKWNPRYEALCSYWKTKPIACTAYHPEAKGKVERAVRYVKENALVGRDFTSFDDLNRWLERWCLTIADEREIKGLFDGENTPKKRFLLEKGKLMKFEQPRTTRLREETRKVDRTGLIQVDGRRYRVPDACTNKDVQIIMDDNTIWVYRKGEEIIALDKAASVYTPKPQSVVDPDQKVEYYSGEAFSHSPWQRDPEVYDRAIRGL